MKMIDLLRHTASDGDRLTAEGVAAAVDIGRGLAVRYDVAVSSGAQRATQTVGCLLAGLGQPVPGGVVVVAALLSAVEDRWRAAYRTAGAGDLSSLRAADPELVTADSAVLADGLHQIFAMLPVGGHALAVGHSPTSEAAVFGLTGVTIEPLGKGAAVTLTEHGGDYSVDAAD
jgi:hypothetical protein